MYKTTVGDLVVAALDQTRSPEHTTDQACRLAATLVSRVLAENGYVEVLKQLQALDLTEGDSPKPMETLREVPPREHAPLRQQ